MRLSCNVLSSLLGSKGYRLNHIIQVMNLLLRPQAELLSSVWEVTDTIKKDFLNQPEAGAAPPANPVAPGTEGRTVKLQIKNELNENLSNAKLWVASLLLFSLSLSYRWGRKILPNTAIIALGVGIAYDERNFSTSLWSACHWNRSSWLIALFDSYWDSNQNQLLI